MIYGIGGMRVLLHHTGATGWIAVGAIIAMVALVAIWPSIVRHIERWWPSQR
jgi:hypothetical protein